MGLAAYRKKPEFGPGTGTITGLVLQDVATAYLIELHSMVLVDGKEIRGTATGLGDQLEADLQKSAAPAAQVVTVDGRESGTSTSPNTAGEPQSESSPK
jgi:hypothetical protein